MERKTILIKNDVYDDRPFYIKKVICHNSEHPELCEKLSVSLPEWYTITNVLEFKKIAED